jgi:hypothetical protein
MRIRLLILILITSIACRNEKDGAGCFAPGGKKTAVTRQLDSFGLLEVRSMAEVYLHECESYKIVLNGPENLLSGISTDTRAGCLRIEDHNYCDWTRRRYEIRADVYAPSYSYIKLTGPCNLYSADTLHGGRLRFDLLGGVHQVDVLVDSRSSYLSVSSLSAGHFRFSGFARSSTMGAEGLGNFDASGLRSEHSYVFNHNVGYMKVNAEKELWYSIYGPGDIYCSGPPDTLICESHTGSGRLIMGND